MNQQAFQHRDDDLLPPTNMRLQSALCFLAATICLAGFGMLYLATEGFTRGTVSDLASSEKLALDDMQEAGILVRDAALPCTMEPHVVLKVKWDSRHHCYCVSTIGLRNIEIETLLPYIDRFPGLRNIDAPYVRSSEIAKIARLVPSLVVTSTD